MPIQIASFELIIMSNEEKTPSDNEPTIIKAFASDDNLKSFGEILSNDTSRKIFFHLMKFGMYPNQIATKLDIRFSLVLYHLGKMRELDLVTITRKKIVKKGKEHEVFKAHSNFIITADKTKEETKKSGLLKKIFRDNIKFVAIGIAIASVFMITDLPNFYTADIHDSGLVMPIFVFPLITLSVGLIIERFFSRKKGKN